MTRYGQTRNELEETLVFAICVAGHNATAKAVDRFLKNLGWVPHKTRRSSSPFEVVRGFDATGPGALEEQIRAAGLGCFNARAKTLRQLAASENLDLATAPPARLEEIAGVGPKTSRFFILHTRPDARVAALDTHVLKYLNAVGVEGPKTTPIGRKYADLERAFLGLAARSGMTVAAFDLMIWRYYTGHDAHIIWIKPDKKVA